MASLLLKMLGNLPDQPKPAAKASFVRRYEWVEPCEEQLFHLNSNALWDMGFDGGPWKIEKTVFLDTETTGLSGGAGTVAFLVGYGFIEGHKLIIRQLLMPDYSCEAEMLELLEQELARFETVVHFNGKRFDMPLLQNRCVLKRRTDFTQHLSQLDLLPPSRRVWKLRLSCCRLSYLEEAVLGMPPRDDIPGSEIPARYFESIKRGDIGLLSDIVEHNRQDIATLTTLLCKLCGVYACPEKLTETADLLSMGRTFEHIGHLRVAGKLYLKASQPRLVRTVQDLKNDKYAGEANLRLYLLYRRHKEYEKCEAVLENMIKRRQMGTLPYLELCKLYEHRIKDYAKARRVCEKLIALSTKEENEELQRRMERIIRKENNGRINNV